VEYFYESKWSNFILFYPTILSNINVSISLILTTEVFERVEVGFLQIEISVAIAISCRALFCVHRHSKFGENLSLGNVWGMECLTNCTFVTLFIQGYGRAISATLPVILGRHLTVSVVILMLFCGPTVLANNGGPCGAGADMRLTLSADTSQKYGMACRLLVFGQAM